MEGVKTGFDVVGVCDHLIVCGEPGGIEKWKPSHQGSVLPRSC